jgi:5'-nucleotidase
MFMRVLVTNDDGITAPGLVALARAAVEAGLDVIVAAPDEQSSGASAAITSMQDDGRTPVRQVALDDLPDVPAFAVEAQPARIVLAGLRGWLDPTPELVLSGINHGANVGRAILHSGTVGAALTAGVNGVRGLAVSLDVALQPDPDQDRNWAAAAGLVPGVLDLLLDAPAGTVLSLNVPDLVAERHRELRRATLAPFGSVQTRVDEADEDHWHMQEVESEEEAGEGTDQALLAAGHPTVTALRPVQEDLEMDLPDRIDLERIAVTGPSAPRAAVAAG